MVMGFLLKVTAGGHFFFLCLVHPSAALLLLTSILTSQVGFSKRQSLSGRWGRLYRII